jgi:hypothetical protein
VRRPIAAYIADATVDRDFAVVGSGQGDGTSIADLPEDLLLEGFGT